VPKKFECQKFLICSLLRITLNAEEKYMLYKIEIEGCFYYNGSLCHCKPDLQTDLCLEMLNPVWANDGKRPSPSSSILKKVIFYL